MPAVQRHHPAVQQLLRPHPLPPEVVHDQDSVVGLHLNRAAVIPRVGVELQVEHVDGQFAAHQHRRAPAPHPARIVSVAPGPSISLWMMGSYSTMICPSTSIACGHPHIRPRRAPATWFPRSRSCLRPPARARRSSSRNSARSQSGPGSARRSPCCRTPAPHPASAPPPCARSACAPAPRSWPAKPEPPRCTGIATAVPWRAPAPAPSERWSARCPPCPSPGKVARSASTCTSSSATGWLTCRWRARSRVESAPHTYIVFSASSSTTARRMPSSAVDRGRYSGP